MPVKEQSSKHQLFKYVISQDTECTLKVGVKVLRVVFNNGRALHGLSMVC